MSMPPYWGTSTVLVIVVPSVFFRVTLVVLTVEDVEVVGAAVAGAAVVGLAAVGAAVAGADVVGAEVVGVCVVFCAHEVNTMIDTMRHATRE